MYGCLSMKMASEDLETPCWVQGGQAEPHPEPHRPGRLLSCNLASWWQCSGKEAGAGKDQLNSVVRPFMRPAECGYHTDLSISSERFPTMLGVSSDGMAALPFMTSSGEESRDNQYRASTVSVSLWPMYYLPVHRWLQCLSFVVPTSLLLSHS